MRLDSEESRHVRALRLAAGAPVRLTDGAGCLWQSRFTGMAGGEAECVLERPLDPPPPLPVELAFPVGNKTHAMWLVEKAAEIGVAVLRPIESARTLSVADAARSPGFWNKAQRRSMAAVKQSGGAWLPEIAPPCPLERYVGENADRGEEIGLRVRLEPSGPPLATLADGWVPDRPVALVVGPEGGWTGAEIDRLDAGSYSRAGLGPRVLRFETAAIVAAGVLAQRVLSYRAHESNPFPNEVEPKP